MDYGGIDITGNAGIVEGRPKTLEIRATGAGRGASRKLRALNLGNWGERVKGRRGSTSRVGGDSNKTI